MKHYAADEYAEEYGSYPGLNDLSRRRITSIYTARAGDEGPCWKIYLDGGAEIWNFDPFIPAPTGEVGGEVTLVILGAHEEQRPVTEIRVGLQSIKLNPLEYAIYDGQLTNGHLVFPQRSRANV
jgi:hypothetical protein